MRLNNLGVWTTLSLSVSINHNNNYSLYLSFYVLFITNMLYLHIHNKQKTMITPVKPTDKIYLYLTDLHCEFVHPFFFQTHRETDRFFPSSGVQLPESNTMYHHHHVLSSSQLKSKVGHILAKVEVLRITSNIDDVHITSSLKGKTGLVSGLVPGFQVWKCPGTLEQTWHQSQMTQIYSNPLNFFA